MIWIIGNRGMLGREVCSLMEEVGTDYIGSDKEVSILEPGALEAFWKAKFGARKPLRWIINCSAYTAVDKAEEEPELCGQLNVTGPGNIAELTEKAGASLLHVSTDYVFDGAGIPDDSGNLRPYKEDDPIGPTGVYGKTKADGEVAAKTGCSRTVVIRTSWLYGQFGPNFVYTMLKLMKEKESIGVVADQYGSPTWAVDLARAIIRIVTGTNPVYGTYHFSNAGTCSWYDFAQSIHRLGREQEVLEKDCIISPVSTDQYPTKAKRPAWSVLDKTKIIHDYQVEVPDWKASLENFFSSVLTYIDDFKDFSLLSQYDLDTAEAMLSAARYLYVAYSCQQAVEKNLKALTCISRRPERKHNLVELAEKINFAVSTEERQLMSELTRYHIQGRYPGDIKKLMAGMTRERAKHIYQEAKSLCSRIRQHPMFSLW